MQRRDLLRTATGIGTASLLFPNQSFASPNNDSSSPYRIVDTNVSLFRWPFRRLPNDNTQGLVNKLRSLGITAWAGSFEGIFHRDIAGVNERLANACSEYPELTAIGSINLDLPYWERDVRQCFHHHSMPGIRLHPNYHGYQLDDPRFTKLIKVTAESKRFVQIAVAVEDTRTQHAIARVADVDLSPLPGLVQQNPEAKVQILNHRGRGLASLLALPGIYTDCARIDGTDSIRTLIQQTSPGRVLFGSHAPFLIPEAALIRIKENALDESELRKTLAGKFKSFA